MACIHVYKHASFHPGPPANQAHVAFGLRRVTFEGLCKLAYGLESVSSSCAYLLLIYIGAAIGMFSHVRGTDEAWAYMYRFGVLVPPPEVDIRQYVFAKTQAVKRSSFTFPKKSS